MRIIGGSRKGLRLATPGSRAGKQNLVIRPTADRAREALFNILGTVVEDAHVLDLYAGTGALGLEALSRGAATAVFVDYSRDALSILEKNISLCGFWRQARVLRRDLSKGLFPPQTSTPQDGFLLIFIDPPYDRKAHPFLLKEIGGNRLLAPGGIIVAEDRAGEELPERAEEFVLTDNRRYGDTGLWFYQHGSQRSR